MPIKIVELILSLAVCLGAGVVGSIFTAPAVKTWYIVLNKPFFQPPSWIFAPVWTILFIFMGISLYLVWTKKTKPNHLPHALPLFAVQLLLNILWSIIFFGLGNYLAAFLEIMVLWCAILLTYREFNKISATAAKLLIPYIIWVTFAAVLNLSIVLLN